MVQKERQSLKRENIWSAEDTNIGEEKGAIFGGIKSLIRLEKWRRSKRKQKEALVEGRLNFANSHKYFSSNMTFGTDSMTRTG